MGHHVGPRDSLKTFDFNVSGFTVSKLCAFVPQMPEVTRILFLCTANYYRSRFAELYFNHLAEQSGIQAHADSCGLEVARWRSYNPGDLSLHTLEELKRLGVNMPEVPREPKQFDPAQLEYFDRCIALSEVEHRPMVKRMCPERIEAFEFWTVEDVGLESVESALARIKKNVQLLIDGLYE